MLTSTDADSATEAVIVLTRLYDAPREMVWAAITDPLHVAQWFGGEGFSSPVCEMDVRPGGLWRHIMRAPNGMEFPVNSVFIEVSPPERLVWTSEDAEAAQAEGKPVNVTTVTLEARGAQTQWVMEARFRSLADRDLAVRMGFGTMVAQGAERLVAVLSAL
jgi:uncharacterized protein YndB with AHSA1/START domain